MRSFQSKILKTVFYVKYEKYKLNIEKIQTNKCQLVLLLIRIRYYEFAYSETNKISRTFFAFNNELRYR